MKIPAEKMKHVLRPGVKILCDIFARNQLEIRVVGGAVRDLILDKIPKDLDFATTATPIEMKTMFEAEQVRVINMRGERHGTITARIEEENFECSTLRIDKVINGPNKEIEFIRDWELDAERRDLTINAMYLGLDGTIYDYFDGIRHLQENVIKFVSNPDQRIQEDHLRILRYFRFFGMLSQDPNTHQPEVLAAIQRNSNGLSWVSGERIWLELPRIVKGNYCCEILKKMIECGVGIHIGLTEEFDCENMTKMYNRLEGQDIDPCTLLAAGMRSEEHVITFVSRVRCSNKTKESLFFIVRYRDLFSNCSLKDIKDQLVDMIYKEKKMVDISIFAVTELLKYVGRHDLVTEINYDFVPKFPFKGGVLVGKVEKKQIQKEMRRLLDLWKASDYSLSREELLDQVG